MSSEVAQPLDFETLANEAEGLMLAIHNLTARIFEAGQEAEIEDIRAMTDSRDTLIDQWRASMLDIVHRFCLQGGPTTEGAKAAIQTFFHTMDLRIGNLKSPMTRISTLMADIWTQETLGIVSPQEPAAETSAVAARLVGNVIVERPIADPFEMIKSKIDAQ